ncbi:MAG: hypothetical protein WCA81_17045 [Rhizomicrobium sp.]
MNKIPVIQTVAESYRFILGSLGQVIGLIWLPVLFLTVGSYFAMILCLPGMADSLESGDISQQALWSLRLLAFDVAMIVLLSVIAVAVTREILNPAKSISYVHFSFGMTELRVVGGFFGLIMLMMTFVFGLLVIGMVALIAVKAGAAGALGAQQALSAIGLIWLIGFLAIFFMLVRLGFLMVPSAVAEGGFGIEQSWKLTKGNFWRIMVIALSTIIPLTLVAVVAENVILGPGFAALPAATALKGTADLARMQAAQMRLISAHLPMLMGLGFLIAPLFYGLTFAPAAFAYRALKAKAGAQQSTLAA